MNVIFEYLFTPVLGGVLCEIPRGAKILCTHSQGRMIGIWASLDLKVQDGVVDLNTELEKEIRYFYFCYTGQPWPGVGKYIGTCFFDDASFIVHVYEVDNI